jgi:hypothetical protein
MKVYNGWRLNVDQEGLFPLLWAIKKKSKEVIKNNLKEIYHLESVDTNPTKHALNVYQEIIRHVKKEESSMVRSAFDPDCNLCIYPYGGKFYARSFCDNVSLIVKNSLDFLDGMAKVEEYYYFDNTDPPDGISDAEWLERGEVWDSIMSDDTGGLGDFVMLEICSASIIVNSPPYWYLDFIREHSM